MDKLDKAALAAIGGGTTAGLALGSITVAVAQTTFLGIGISTTTVALPVAGLVAAGGAVTWGGYRVWRALRN
jgi:fatty acid desaturase